MFLFSNHTAPETTIGDCVARCWDVRLSCAACAHEGRLRYRGELAKLPANCSLAELAERARCHGCGGAEGMISIVNGRVGGR